MEIIWNTLGVMACTVAMVFAVTFIGWWRGLWDWEGIKDGMRSVKNFFSTRPGSSPSWVQSLGLGKLAAIIFMSAIYLGTLLLLFVLGAFISKNLSPFAGWPAFLILSLLFIVWSSVNVPQAKFGQVIIWGFPTRICLPTGTYPIPFPDLLVSIQEFPTKEIPVTFVIDNIPIPDGTRARVTIKGLVIPDRNNVTTLTDIGGEEGVKNNLATRAEPCVKEWFQNTDHGPQTWQEAMQTGSGVLPIVMKAILGDRQLPKIPSPIPTPALLRYFTTPRPTQTPAETKQWGENWERLEALLPPRGSDEEQKLKSALEERRRTIQSLTNGQAAFVDTATGTIFKTLGFEDIEILGGVAEEAVKAAKEKARGNAGLTAINDGIAQARAIVDALETLNGAPLPAEAKLGLFREELRKILVDLKLVDKGAAAMHIIPGLPDLAQAVSQLLGRGTGGSQQVADLAAEVARLQAMITAATRPAGGVTI